MKWFKHFAGAHDNNKLTKVRMRYGADGYAIYWYCLELISSDLGTLPEVTFELKHDAEVIGFNLKIDSGRVEEIMTYMIQLELFKSIDGIVTCFKLAKYLDKKNTRNKTIHKIIDVAKQEINVTGLSRTLTDKERRFPLDTDTDTDTDIKKESKKKKSNVFKKPNIEMLENFILENNFSINAQQFLDHYDSNGWKVGKNSMKDWKATARNWERREKQNRRATKADDHLNAIRDL